MISCKKDFYFKKNNKNIISMWLIKKEFLYKKPPNPSGQLNPSLLSAKALAKLQQSER